MNTCYNQNEHFNSNSGTISGYSHQSTNAKRQVRSGLEFFLYIIAKLLSALCCSKVVSKLRVCGVVGALVGFVGIIGAMERGTLGLGLGLLIGAVLIGVEYLCLRSRKA